MGGKLRSFSKFGSLVVIYFILILDVQARKTRSHSSTEGSGPTSGSKKAKDYKPQFLEPIENLTVSVGRDATFHCVVAHLRGYRVGWVKADTKAIQAIHDHVITHNPRVSVSHSDNSVWNLHIKSVQREDGGQYMCQINTDPMMSQIGILEIVVPPDFIDAETSGDVTVNENLSVNLKCAATGIPPPSITWRREDGEQIMVKENNGGKTLVTAYQGEILSLQKIQRSEMGAYLCIASNGVPPTISKRILVNVNFHPIVRVPSQLVGAPLGTDVTLECLVQASPKAITYWVRDGGRSCNGPNCVPGGMLIPSTRFETQSFTKSIFETKMVLSFKNLARDDCGSYRCVAKNSMGEADAQIRLYEIPGPTRVYNGMPVDEEDYNDQLGSAEREQDEEWSNSVDRRPMDSTQNSPRGTQVRKMNHGPANSAPLSLWFSTFKLLVLLVYLPGHILLARMFTI